MPIASATRQEPGSCRAYVYAQGIVKRMTGNPSFPNPAPSLAAVTTAIADLQAAEAVALARTKGAVALRNEKRKALVALLQALRAHIQSTVDAAAANGPSIPQSAHLKPRCKRLDLMKPNVGPLTAR